MSRTVALSCIAAALVQGIAYAAPLEPARVPEPLKPWVGWVLHGHENAACPVAPGEGTDGDGAEEGQAPAPAEGCFWPSRLDLAITAKSGRFEQSWHAFRAGWVPLPGDAHRWPQDVRVDGRSAPVTPRDERPGTWLAPGDHRVAGTFAWEERPESLRVPVRTGLLALTLDGRPVAQPSRDAEGSLWLEREEGGAEAESRLDIAVHRLVSDEVPLTMETRVKLDVSGRGREVLLGRALPEGFVPMSLQSPVPARLEPDGRLRVQVRAGTWTLSLVSRSRGPVDGLTAAPTLGQWASEEVWAFDARPDLRVVSVEGVPSVDPQQTTLPSEWRSLPAYRMRPGDVLRLVQERRGDADPAPDRLVLNRSLWLDFDGRGVSARDTLSGTLTRSWRLAMDAPSVLGRVSVDGRDQLITRTGNGGPPGVEIRQGKVRAVADSRVEGSVRDLPAVGWAHDFHRVEATLHLPPGWRLFHASGVDDVPETWLRGWSLLDLFLVLVAAMATWRLWGWKWGILALAALGLSLPESGAPRWSWLAVIAAGALLRVLPQGRLASFVRMLYVGAIAALALLLAPFAVQHAREGLHPTMERPWQALAVEGGAEALSDSTRPSSGEDEVAQGLEAEGQAAEQVVQRSFNLGMKANMAQANVFGQAYRQKLDLSANDPRAVAQTGQGTPGWKWKEIRLRWSGPVDRPQRLSLWLVPPAAGTLLAFLRIALLALLFARIARVAGPLRLLPRAPAMAAFALLAMPAPARAGGMEEEPFPPERPALLDELRTRLLEKPDCDPECVSSPRLALEASGSVLRIRQEIHAAAPSAAALPGGLGHWSPRQVLVDGKPPASLETVEGTLHVFLPAGVHQVLLEGALPRRDSVQVPLPLRPAHVESSLRGWTLSGVDDEGVAEDALQLDREGAGDEAAPSAAAEPAALPPFVRVERALLLGLDWAVHTKVVRATPPGVPVVLEVPLLEGESVTTADVRAEGGRAVVNMGPHTGEVEWRSVLRQRPELVLTAPKETAWTEVWRLEAGPVWHVEMKGIPLVHASPDVAARIPEWRPWPGEEVRLSIGRPEAVPGPTLTVLSAGLTTTPGLRSSDTVLVLRLSSSRGGRHAITLPEGGQLQSLQVDGRAQPDRQDGRLVSFPLSPGRQSVRVEWREPRGISLFFRSSDVDLALPAVNTSVTVELGRDRWVWLAGGLHAGPAVLFWSLLVGLLLAAIGLGRLGRTPLRTHHWMLLALGLTQVPVPAAGAVAAWLLSLGLRRAHGADVRGDRRFDLMQLALAGLTALALGILFTSIRRGLLGLPDMQVAGNGSSATSLRWFQDRTGPALARAWVVSVPLAAWRLSMLAWALWIAVSLIGWLRWGWGAFSEGGLWRPFRRRRVVRPGTGAGEGAVPTVT